MKSFQRSHPRVSRHVAACLAGLLLLGVAGCAPAAEPPLVPSTDIPVDTTPPSAPPTAGPPSDPAEGLGLRAEPDTTDPAKYGAAVAEAVFSYDMSSVTRSGLIDYLSEWLVPNPEYTKEESALSARESSISILEKYVIFPRQLWDTMAANETIVSSTATAITLDEGHELFSPERFALGVHLVSVDVTVLYATPTSPKGIDEEFRLSMHVQCPVKDPAAAGVPEWATVDQCGLVRIFDGVIN